ncbi:MAG TPA: helix-turn-helix domain-containing protein [Acidimicrobiales bacterium]|nr:helix-turn-helix domain-containing protein [Acidimicrobiales bacterium]
MVVSASSSPRLPEPRPHLLPWLEILEEPATLDALSHQVLQALAGSTAWLDLSLQREVAELFRASAHSLGPILAGTATGFQPPREALRLGRRMARLGLGVGEILTAFGDMRQQISDLVATVLALLDVPADQQLRLALEAHQLVMWWLDAIQLAVLAEHGLERDSLTQATQRRRQELVHGVLDGTHGDTDEASRHLGYNLRGSHTAVVAWASDQPDDDGSIADYLRRLHPRGGTAALVLEGPGSETRAWLPAVGSTDLFTAHPPPPGVVVAVGNGLRGPGGFRLSHRQAQAARDLAPRLRGRPSVVRYAEYDVLAHLAAGDPETLVALATTELGELGADTPAAERLRESLAAYFAHSQRIGPAAETLAVHPNTLRYRLQLAEAAIGRPLGEARLRLELALLVHRDLAPPPDHQ